MKDFRLGWIADNFFGEVKRGAEIEDKILIEEAERRGHEVIRISAGQLKMVSHTNLLIVANCLDKFNIGELLSYISMRPYVRVEHDLRAPQFPWYPSLAGDAIINVYHSPFQEQMITKASGEYPHFLHSMCLPEEFQDMHKPRYPLDNVLYVGDYSKEKGFRNLEAWLLQHPDCKIYHYGGGFEKTHPQMVEMGEARQSEMPYIYNSYSSVIFLPLYPQACSRIIAEAYLCKVPNIITNELDGFTSYGYKPEDYDHVRDILINGHKHFWDRIEEELKELEP